jgi:hypothetical protein
MRPWYKIHFSTLFVLAIVLAVLVFINIPGDRPPMSPFRYSHGWPYVYLERLGTEHAFWTFAGMTKKFDGSALALNALAALCIVALVALPCELWIRRNGQLFRFGIRSMLVATALLAVAMGLSVREIHRCYRQQQALQELSQYGSIATKRKLQPYDWLRNFFGDYTHGTVDYVEVTSTRPIDRLPDLSVLADVEQLRLELSNVPENVDQLTRLPKLRDLDVTLTAIDAAGLEKLPALTELPQLTGFGLRGDAFDDKSLLQISRQTTIRGLIVFSSTVTEKGFASLRELKSLRHLALDDSAMQKSDAALAQLPQLPSLMFVGNKLTPQDETRIRKLWPEARILIGITGDTGEEYLSVIREYHAP